MTLPFFHVFRERSFEPHVYNGQNMIAHLRGKLLSRHPNRIVVETAGVGYEATISVPTFSELPECGSEVALHIHTHVREDQIALYGFVHSAEKRLFEKLITVSGIGPKLAITILSGMAASEMTSAIRGNDLARLTKIPGVGRKTAERMVLELRDKLSEPGEGSAPVNASSLSAMEQDVLSALENLGYQRPIAEKAIASGAKSSTNSSSNSSTNKESRSFDSIFREALARLSK